MQVTIFTQWSALAVPLIFLLAATLITFFKKSVISCWQISFMATWLSLGAALHASLGKIYLTINNNSLAKIDKVDSYHSQTSYLSGVVHVEPLSLIMLALITIVALVIIRFSKNYLNREPRETDYQFWFMVTLTSVSVMIISNHFLIFLFAWIMISVGLHQLLMFYPERPRAALAAHKKFLISRLADTCMIAGVAFLYSIHHTFVISTILNNYQQANQPLYSASQAAAILFAISALLKCAQLPLHGWLMQVMEAPTPVSALLHAGVINMGGFLMILLAPLMVQSPIAQWLLIIIGGITAVVASLIMMTRISIKVMLAWSTCAQMGFMLVECGLGYYELALLHLIAHSFYKAYTFLSTGDAVQQYLQENLAVNHPANNHLANNRLVKNRVVPTLPRWLAGMLLAATLVTGLFFITNTFSTDKNGFFTIALIVSIAIAVLLSEHFFNRLTTSYISLMAATLMLLYVTWHALFSLMLPSSAITPTLDGLKAMWIIVLFIALFFCYIVLRFYPYSKLGKWLYLNLYAGLYLDEWVTRATLKMWPAKLPSRK